MDAATAAPGRVRESPQIVVGTRRTSLRTSPSAPA